MSTTVPSRSSPRWGSMDRRVAGRWLLSMALLGSLACGSADSEDPTREATGLRPITQVPLPRRDDLFQHRYESMRSQPDREQIELVFLGDSILRRFETEGRETWNDHYAKHRLVANFAIEGDRTQNVLWRIEDGLFDGMTPRAIVVGIGTNNLAESEPREIALGVEAIIEALQARVPDGRLLLLGLLPRGDWLAGDRLRTRVEETNVRLAALARESDVAYLDVGPWFVQSDGALDRTRLPDGLHPGAEGYRALAEALESELARILGDPIQGTGK